MKRILFVLLTVTLIVSLFSGCNEVATDTSNNDLLENLFPATNSFAESLDKENLVAGISQSDFISQMEKYSYKGTNITDIAIGYHYDGLFGGGFSASDELFGFSNSFYQTEEETKYSNSFYTYVALDGLTLPYGIDFDDSLTEVFQKIGIKINPTNGFVADENSTETMTLFKDEDKTLVFENYNVFPLDDYKYSHTLRYTETKEASLSDGRIKTVTRTIELSFITSDKLERFSMSVCEKYPPKESQTETTLGIDGTRIWDRFHPDDSERNEFFSRTLPILNTEVEHREDYKVYLDGEYLLGGSANGCDSFYLCDLTGDGIPELCLGMNMGSGFIDERIEIIDLSTRTTVFSLSDRFSHDYYLFLRNGVLCVKEIESPTNNVSRTGVLISKDSEITVVWDKEIDITIDRDPSPAPGQPVH